VKFVPRQSKKNISKHMVCRLANRAADVALRETSAKRAFVSPAAINLLVFEGAGSRNNANYMSHAAQRLIACRNPGPVRS
jgi:hypothetical protein